MFMQYTQTYMLFMSRLLADDKVFLLERLEDSIARF
jgi:hypothetical protein